jgi:hypothetical protein
MISFLTGITSLLKDMGFLELHSVSAMLVARLAARNVLQ